MNDSLALQLTSMSFSSSGSSLESPPLPLTPQEENLIGELSRLPIPSMINVLDKMCYIPSLVQLQRALLVDPFNVCKILTYGLISRTKLTTYFLWLEKCSKDFVWTVVENICYFVMQNNDVPDEHLLGFQSLLNLGTFLVETGWHAEAIILLNTVKGKAKGHPVKILKVLKVSLLAEALSSRDEAVFLTISQIKASVGIVRSIVLSAELSYCLAVAYFESGDFDESYRYGMLALRMLIEGVSPNELIVKTFCQLCKSCLAKKLPFRAKHAITQALSWAWQNFGPKSAIYAEVLEVYAFYLLMINDHDSAVKALNRAKQIYYCLYGYLALQPEQAQGNLALRLYLESYEFQELGSIEQYIDYIGDLGDKRRSQVITGSDDRQMLAITRMRTMMALKELCQDECKTVANNVLWYAETYMTVKEAREIFLSQVGVNVVFQ